MGFLINSVEFSKIIISIGIMAYAYFFLRQTERYIERKPWEYLYIASMVLFLVELITVLQLFQAEYYNKVVFDQLRRFLEFVFLGFLLFAFINQHHLLRKERMLVLTRAQDKQDSFFSRLSNRVSKMKLEAEEQKERKREHAIDERIDREIAKNHMRTPQEMKLEQALESNQKEDASLTDAKESARKLIASCEEVIKKHQERADSSKVAALQQQLDDLKKALRQSTTTANDILVRIHKIIGPEKN